MRPSESEWCENPALSLTWQLMNLCHLIPLRKRTANPLSWTAAHFIKSADQLEVLPKTSSLLISSKAMLPSRISHWEYANILLLISFLFLFHLAWAAFRFQSTIFSLSLLAAAQSCALVIKKQLVLNTSLSRLQGTAVHIP